MTGGAGEADVPSDTVASLAQLYLGNILFALERCAMSLEGDAKPNDAAFYRAIARKLAEAHGTTRPEARGQRSEGR